MIKNIYDHLKPGGRVAGTGSSPMVPPDQLHFSEKYGRTYTFNDDYFKKNGT